MVGYRRLVLSEKDSCLAPQDNEVGMSGSSLKNLLL